MVWEEFKAQLPGVLLRLLSECWWILAILLVAVVLANRMQHAERAKRRRARRAAWLANVEAGVKAALPRDTDPRP